MTLPTPGKYYDQNTESQRNRIIELADSQNLKRNVDVDIQLGVRVFMRSPNGNRWQISVNNSGALIVTAA